MKSAQDFAEEFARVHGKKVNEEDPENVPLKGKKIRSRRIIKVLFSKCPLCHLKLTTKIPDIIDLKTIGKKFIMLQFQSNPDNTGIESYWCGDCKKFFMMMISPRLIAIEPTMKM